jgi:F0F1-type ATP synthase membrane subunit c/vacuolar-type H+-ATPase subunit K
LLFAGGVCCCVGVDDLDVEADLLAEFEELAGALEGAGAGAGVAACVDAGCDASAEVSDFFVRFFFVVALESLVAELSALAEPAAAGVASAEVSDFLERFFLVVVVLESPEAVLSAAAG